MMTTDYYLRGCILIVVEVDKALADIRCIYRKILSTIVLETKETMPDILFGE